MQKESNSLTEKIELARTLPGTILETAEIPIEGLSVKDGIPLINGLPVSNLSEGEKLDLCIDVAIQNPSGLQIIIMVLRNCLRKTAHVSMRSVRRKGCSLSQPEPQVTMN